MQKPSIVDAAVWVFQYLSQPFPLLVLRLDNEYVQLPAFLSAQRSYIAQLWPMTCRWKALRLRGLFAALLSSILPAWNMPVMTGSIAAIMKP